MADERDGFLAEEAHRAEGPRADEDPAIENELDHLRRKSARVSSSYEEMEPSGRSGFSWSSFTPAQRLIIAVLVLLNILVISFGILVVTGRFSL